MSKYSKNRKMTELNNLKRVSGGGVSIGGGVNAAKDVVVKETTKDTVQDNSVIATTENKVDVKAVVNMKLY